MTAFKLSELPENTVIAASMEAHSTQYIRTKSDNAEQTPYWHALFAHCVDCAETDNLTLEQADRDLTDFKTISMPWGVVVQMALMLRDEHIINESEDAAIGVSDLINSGIEAHKKSIERNAKYETEGI